MSQQKLRLQAPSSARFESFWSGPNGAAVAALKEFSLNDEDGQYLLIGPQASGKSHLAQACCRVRWEAERRASYFDLMQTPLDDAALTGIVPSGLIVVDGLELLEHEQEICLLRLVDQVRAANGKLLLCARDWPEKLPIQIPDLRSRLQWGGMLELQAMSEDDLRQLLAHRAHLLGVRLQPRVQDYLIKRIPRNPGALVDMLEQALELAVSSGRQLTVPLVRELLSRYA